METPAAAGEEEGGAVKLLVINPNTTQSMTEQVVAQVRTLAGPKADVRGVTATCGYPVIDSRASFAAGARAALDAWRAQTGKPDAVLLACFGDPGLDALRALARVPVAGMAEAALQAAMAAGERYRIVTAGAGWRDLLLEAAEKAHANALLEGIRILDTTGLAIARDQDGFMARVQAALHDAERAGVRTVILGGAGFAGMKRRLRFDGVLIDGLEAAVRKLVS